MNEYIDIPQELKYTHQINDIFPDIIYTQGNIIPVTIYKTIKFIEIQDITYRNIPILNQSFYNTFIVYNQAGLKIQRIQAKPEFKPMEDTFKYIEITINYATEQGHVP